MLFILVSIYFTQIKLMFSLMLSNKANEQVAEAKMDISIQILGTHVSHN